MAEKSMEDEVYGTETWAERKAREEGSASQPETQPGGEGGQETGGGQPGEGGAATDDKVPQGDGEKPGEGNQGGEPGKGPAAEPPRGEDGPEYGKDGHTPKGVQQRFSKMSRKIHEQDAEIASLRAQLAKLQPPPQGPKSREECANDEEWVKGVVDHGVEAAVQSALAKERERVAFENSRANFGKNEEDVRTRVPDYDEVMDSDVGNLDVDRATMKYILDSAEGPMIQYTLKKIPSVREQFLAAPVANRLAVVQGIERRLVELKEDASKKTQAAQPQPAAQPKQQQPQRQEPPKPAAPEIRAPMDVKAPPSGAPDPATCSFEEWENYNGG